METASSVASTRGGSLQNPPPTPSRKEWRAVSDSHNVGNTTDYDLEQLKLNQTDERTIYENGSEPVDLDYYSITMDGELLQQQIHNISKQKGELQQMEIELRAQMIAMEFKRNFESQSTEYANAAARMQEQLHDKERSIREMERMIEEKDRELHAIKLDNEAAWAKEGLLREQNKELATLRREREHSEAERSQSIHKLSELQEHIQEKESQLNELKEQHRIAQETILYKDEQLREAQGWIARAQEMDALQSSTNHSLQAELRERTEQYNHLWHGCQRQFMEMERLHSHTVQQLQLELANVREGGLSKTSSNGASQIIQNSGNQFEAHGNNSDSANVNAHSNGKNTDNISSFTSSDDRPTQVHNNRVDGVSASHLGMYGYSQAGQMNPLHSFIMHQQEMPQLVQPQGPSPHVVQSVLLQQKAVPHSSQMPMQNHVHPSQGVHGLINSDAKSDYEVPANEQSFGQGYGDVQEAQYGSSTPASSLNEQAVKSGNGPNHSENSFQDISSQFRDALRIDSNALNQRPEEANGQVSHGEHNGAGSIMPETLVSSGKAERNLESALLDERSLLTCILRTIPAGGRIRISSTLPNRLGKMLAPLHWHDYRKKYGKLDDFVASHLELFVIEDDYIQVRDGAQKMVAASAAAAKVAAAATASSAPNSIYVAMTPMAQSQGLKKNDKTVQRGRQSSDYMVKQ
ncbi:PREDICTED: ninein isoform X3 [Camelina sativa]|uniref:Ninein isoform X3 n=1 Tax=Camelina sativa TaxID=90675 RepID=A0ABM0X9R1_CAMSA|nr:PREDICTED: ninein isoform X3 [Camelina sativa]